MNKSSFEKLTDAWRRHAHIAQDWHKKLIRWVIRLECRDWKKITQRIPFELALHCDWKLQGTCAQWEDEETEWTKGLWEQNSLKCLWIWSAKNMASASHWRDSSRSHHDGYAVSHWRIPCTSGFWLICMDNSFIIFLWLDSYLHDHSCHPRNEKVTLEEVGCPIYIYG